MKKYITLIVILFALSLTVNAQQKKEGLKSSNSGLSKSEIKFSDTESKNLQNIWSANSYLAKKLLDIEKPIINKDEIRSLLESQSSIKQINDLTNYLKKFYSIIPSDILLENKRNEFKLTFEKLSSSDNENEIINSCQMLQKCINQEYLPESWDNKAWLEGFKTK